MHRQIGPHQGQGAQPDLARGQGGERVEVEFQGAQAQQFVAGLRVGDDYLTQHQSWRPAGEAQRHRLQPQLVSQLLRQGLGQLAAVTVGDRQGQTERRGQTGEQDQTEQAKP